MSNGIDYPAQGQTIPDLIRGIQDYNFSQPSWFPKDIDLMEFLAWVPKHKVGNWMYLIVKVPTLYNQDLVRCVHQRFQEFRERPIK